MIAVVDDIKAIYKTYFQGPYTVQPRELPNEFNMYGTPVKGEYMGKEVFLPITLKSGNLELTIRCATIRIANKKQIVKTVVSERIGTVKEQFSIGDYQITIKGVLLGEGHQNLPEQKMQMLLGIYESTKPVEIQNALTDFVLDVSNHIVIESLDFPEVEGKTIRHKPFTMVCESDYIDTLILK